MKKFFIHQKDRIKLIKRWEKPTENNEIKY